MHSTMPNPLSPLLAQLPQPRERLSDYLIEHAASRGASEAAVDERRRITYAALAQEVARVAALLEALGVEPGDRVAVLTPPSVDFLVSFLATTSLGAIWLGLNPKHTRAELQYVLSDAAPRIVLARSRIAGRDFLDDLRALVPRSDAGPRAVLLDQRADAADYPSVAALIRELDLESRTAIPSRPKSSDAALLVYTSGTTGLPKGAMLSHGALIRGALVRACAWPVEPFRSLNNLPVNHIGGAGDIACTTLIAGGCQVFMEKFDPAGTLRLLTAERVSFWYQIPTMLQLCLDHPAAQETDWSHLDTVIWSGGRAAHSLIDRLAKVARHLGVDYSMTESVGAITLTPQTRDHAMLAETVGWIDPARGVRIVQPGTSTAVAEGEAGEVQLNDAWRFNGYRTPTPPDDAYAEDGWFRTGDLAVHQPDGTLKLVGRSKEMFKSGGYNVYPKEIELVIETHPDVLVTAVVPASDALYGEIGVAFVVSREGALSAAALDAHCRGALANYKIPKHFILTPEMPMLPIGKIDRVALRKHAQRLTR
jgi:acyl-CoA synthetase (AMP-forming)/AMP-acid ligase II